VCYACYGRVEAHPQRTLWGKRVYVAGARYYGSSHSYLRSNCWGDREVCWYFWKRSRRSPRILLSGLCVNGARGRTYNDIENNSRKLWDWHVDIRQRWDRAVRKEEPAPREYNPTVGGRRADLVLFQGNHSKKTETDFLCLVEFKKWYLDAGDIKKIRDWFRFLDTCKYGMVCGFTEVPKYEAYLAQMEDTAIASGDKWVLGRIARPLGTIEDSQNFQTFAQIMENPNYRR
jgi:hypothetical protein